MNYYKTNALYDYLDKHKKKENFFWASGNMWLLVYGDNNAEPKVLIVVSGDSISLKLSELEIKAIKIAKELTKGTNIATGFIRFDPVIEPIEKVLFWDKDINDFIIIPINKLKDYFSGSGLPLNDNKVEKLINDKSSSPYHNWQRNNMGNGVVVSDIDLIRLENDIPIEIIELKRSKINLKQWKPYRQDYINFNLLDKLAKQRGIKFRIVYNYRQNSPSIYDDIQKLKIFSYDYKINESSFEEYKILDDFVENK